MVGRTHRRILVIAVAIIAIAVVALIYISPHKSGNASSQRSSSPSTPLASSLASPSNLSCPATELKLTGVFEECATIDKGQSCSSGSPNPLWVVLLHGTKHDFLLYVEVNGVYHGPGTYALAPWLHDSLGVSDRVAKVAVREYVSGRLWESSAGSLTIDNLGDSGWVYAGLGASVNSPVQVELNLAGWWACG